LSEATDEELDVYGMDDGDDDEEGEEESELDLTSQELEELARLEAEEAGEGDEDDEDLAGEEEEDEPGSAEEAAEQEEDPFFNVDDMEKFILNAEAEEEGGPEMLGADEDDEEMAYDYVYGEKAGQDEALFAGQRNLKSKLKNEDLEDDYYTDGAKGKKGGPVDAARAKFSDFFDLPDRFVVNHLLPFFVY